MEYRTVLDADGRRDERYIDAQSSEEAARMTIRAWRYDTHCRDILKREGYEHFVFSSGRLIGSVDVYERP